MYASINIYIYMFLSNICVYYIQKLLLSMSYHTYCSYQAIEVLMDTIVTLKY